MFARLLTDLLSLSGVESFRVYDTDYPNGDLSGYFPESSRVVDFSKTGGQVEIFDTILSEPQFDYVLDLEANLLTRFFKVFSDIGFEQAAYEAKMTVSVYYVLDRKISSVQTAKELAKECVHSEFIPVRNEAMGNILTIPQAANIYSQIKKRREIHLPRLSVNALNHIDQPNFSFSDFLARNGQNAPRELRIEIWAFLEAVYNQQQTGQDGGFGSN